jgi:hypothetical protein
MKPSYKPVKAIKRKKTFALNEWCYDSGSGYHCTNDLSNLKDYHPVDAGVRVGDNRPLKGYYLGSTTLELVALDGSTTPVTFTKVLYVP